MAFRNHKFDDKIVFSCCDIHGGLLFYFSFLSYTMDICADEQQFYLFRRPDELTETEEAKKNTRI